MEKLQLIATFLIFFSLFRHLHGACSLSSVCDCKYKIGSVDFGVCSIGVDGSAVATEYANIMGQINNLQTQINVMESSIVDAQNQLTFLNSLTNLPTVVGQVKKHADAVKDFFSDGSVKAAVEAVAKSGATLGDVVKSSLVNEYDFAGVLGDPLDKFLDSINTIGTWVFKNLIRPSTGVFKNVTGDCWFDSLKNDVGFGVGVSNDPGVGVSMSISGISSLKCFVRKLRLFKSVLARTEPSSIPGMDAMLTLKKMASDLRMAVGELNKTFSVESKPSWCNTSLTFLYDIPPAYYPFLSSFATGVNKLNQISGEDGVVGKVANTIKKYVCEAITVPGALTQFADQFSDFVESRQSFNPTASVNRMFNLFSMIAENFLDKAAEFEGKFFNESNEDYPCFLYHFNQGDVSISVGIAAEIKILPPRPLSLSAGVGCSSLNCWACFTGLSTLFSVIPGLKRETLARQNMTTNNTTKTMSFVVNDFSSSSLSNCVRYSCNKGTWNDNVCACVCDDASEIWTPQYGCYNSEEYEKGNAPSGAKPNANPNNPNYDETVDPYSNKYDPSKDPNPYYKPYEAVETQTSSSFMLSVFIVLLVSVFF